MTSKPRNFPRFGRVQSGNRLDFARPNPHLNKPQGTSITFTSNTTWVAPAGSQIIQRLVGKGSDGKPETGTHAYVEGYIIYVTPVTYGKSSGQYTYGFRRYSGIVEGPKPANIRQYDGEDANFIYYQDLEFSSTFIDKGDYVAATTGGASTGFDQIFPGGPSGQPAVPATYNNVRVSGGTSYQLTVPLGGYITIEY